MSCSPPHPRARVSALPTGQSGASPEHYISGPGSRIFGRVTLRGDSTFFKLKFLIFNQIAGFGSRPESLPPSPWKHPQDSGSGPIEAAADGPLERIHGEEGAGPKRAPFPDDDGARSATGIRRRVGEQPLRPTRNSNSDDELRWCQMCSGGIRRRRKFFTTIHSDAHEERWERLGASSGPLAHKIFFSTQAAKSLTETSVNHAFSRRKLFKHSINRTYIHGR